MHVLILGATSATGILLVQELLTAGHTIVIYARSPNKLPEDLKSNPTVTVVEGQINDREGVDKAVIGVDAVVSALGPPSGSFSSMFNYPHDAPIAQAYKLIIDAMKRHGVKRLIALCTPSWKDPNDKFSLLYWLMVCGVFLTARGCYQEMVAIGDTVTGIGKDLDLEWTLARVPMLTYSATKEVTAGYVGDGKIAVTLSRTAFAAWVVQELEVGQWKWKSPSLSDPQADFSHLTPA